MKESYIHILIRLFIFSRDLFVSLFQLHLLYKMILKFQLLCIFLFLSPKMGLWFVQLVSIVVYCLFSYFRCQYHLHLLQCESTLIKSISLHKLMHFLILFPTHSDHLHQISFHLFLLYHSQSGN